MGQKRFVWCEISLFAFFLSFFFSPVYTAYQSSWANEQKELLSIEPGKQGVKSQAESGPARFFQARGFPNLMIEPGQDGLTITILALHLFTAEMTLSLKGKELLNQVLPLLQKDASARVIIRGHADSRGSEKINQMVSQKRADRVKEYLVSYLHMDPSRVIAEAWGASHPWATNATEAGRALNRRVEIIVWSKEAP